MKTLSAKFFALVYLLVAFLLYGKTLYVGFMSDDWHELYVAAHQTNVWHFFVTNIIGTRSGSSYGPLWNVFFTWQYHIFGMRTFWYHAVSIALLAITSWLVMLLAYSLTHKKSLSIITGFIFLILGNHVESVAWVSSQPHLIGTIFYLASIIGYIRYITGKDWRWYGASVFFLFLSIFTKEIGITAFAAWVIIELIYADKVWKKETIIRVGKHLVIPIVIISVYLFLRACATGLIAGYYGNTHVLYNFLEQLRTAVELSVNMLFSYPYRVNIVAKVFAHPYIIFSVLGGFIFWVVKFQKNYRKQLLLIAICYVISLLPYLSLGYSPQGNEGERYAYLPSVWATLGVSLLFFDIFQKITIRYVRIIFYAILLCLASFQVWTVTDQIRDWQAAGLVVERGFASLEKFNFGADDVVYFIGIPDTIRGAELFRNATLLALDMKGKKWQGDRILMMSALPREDYITSFLTVSHPTADKFILSLRDPRFYFVGFPVVETPFAQFKLTPFARATQTGKQIEVMLHLSQDGKLQMDNKSVKILYYDQGEFRLLAL